MARIETVRNPHNSIFQSLAEDVANRVEAHSGPVSSRPQGWLQRLRAAWGRYFGGGRDGTKAGTSSKVTSSRLPSGHVATAIGHRLAEMNTNGHSIPAAVPPDLEQTHGGVARTLWTCSTLAAEILEAKFLGDHAKVSQKRDELEFSTCDPKWVEAVEQYLEYFGPKGGRREIPYIRHREMNDFVVDTLPANAKVAVIGDWGTGTDDAIATLEEIKKHGIDTLIHLGDIYYSGTETETERFFLDILNRVLERDTQPISVYTLTGNHDMYSGGAGYYKLLPKLNPPPVFRSEQAQPASYFCLRGAAGAWQFLGMDTGLHDHDPFTVSADITYLEPGEEAWHIDKIQRFAAQGGRTILLSHHQLFSAFDLIGGKNAKKAAGEEAANPKLLASYRKFQQAAAGGSGEIAAWFWGHEHNLDVYEPYLGLAKGRCMGHGAIPAFVEKNPYEVEESLPDPPPLVADPADPGRKLELGTIDEVYAHGWVLIELNDRARTATASYYQETDYSKPMYVENL